MSFIATYLYLVMVLYLIAHSKDGKLRLWSAFMWPLFMPFIVIQEYRK